ncbi:MAG: hypothetical protein AAB400_00045 [Patescibacteria group bacterium]
MTTFSLDISRDQKKIVFHNTSKRFVEVLFDIDGMDARCGGQFSLSVRGYAIPPEMEKSISKLKDGNPLPMRNQGTVTAYVFDGDARYRDEDIDLPAFLRHRIVRKIRFTRSGNKPIEIVQKSY